LSPKTIQRLILAQAAARTTGFALPLPPSISAPPEEVAALLEEMIDLEYLVERPLLPHEKFWLEDCLHSARVLVITGLGQRALAADTASSLLQRFPNGRINSEALPNFEKPRSSLDGGSPPPRQNAGKLQLLIQALENPEGATVAELAKLTSWKENSVRSALAVQVQRRMGLRVDTVRAAFGALRYRILRP
jgi:hypothetical protein